MSKAPAMPLFVDAYLADTMHLSPDEDGIYLRLLMCAWRMEGKLPDDDTKLARFARVSRARWVKRYRPVMMQFFEKNDIFLIQKRLKKEWENCAAYREQKSVAGKNSALKRKKTASTDVPTGRQRNGQRNANGQANETPTPSPKEEEMSLTGHISSSGDTRACELAPGGRSPASCPEGGDTPPSPPMGAKSKTLGDVLPPEFPNRGVIGMAVVELGADGETVIRVPSAFLAGCVEDQRLELRDYFGTEIMLGVNGAKPTPLGGVDKPPENSDPVAPPPSQPPATPSDGQAPRTEDRT